MCGSREPRMLVLKANAQSGSNGLRSDRLLARHDEENSGY